jgi:hypothetical protein
MDWAGFRFQDPAWLWAALLCPLVLVAAWLRERDQAARAVSFPGASRLLRVPPRLRVSSPPPRWRSPDPSTARCART